MELPTKFEDCDIEEVIKRFRAIGLPEVPDITVGQLRNFLHKGYILLYDKTGLTPNLKFFNPRKK